MNIRRTIFCFVLGLIVLACAGQAQVITTVVGTSWSFPSTPLPAINAPLSQTNAVAVDTSGNVYIADGGNNMVYRVTPDGTLTVVAGNGLSGYTGDGGPAVNAALSSPYGIAVDTAGNLYISDVLDNVIRKVAADGVITTIAGNGTAGFSGDGGPATSAQLSFPTQLAVDHTGNLYVCDWNNNRVRKITPGGMIMPFAGNGQSGETGDGGLATAATLSGGRPGLAVDAAGNVYIADSNEIRVVTAAGIINTVPGSHLVESPLFGGAAFDDVAVDTTGNLYIADLAYDVIYKLTPGGSPKIFAGVSIAELGFGSVGFSGDGGPATKASLNEPFGVAVDATGGVYIADTSNSRIRKVSSDGIINTTAGNGGFRFAGDGGPAANAALVQPLAITPDASGNIFIADFGNDRVRKVSSGIINTVAGNGVSALTGNGGPATSASFAVINSVAVDHSEDIFIADVFDVREVNGNSGLVARVPYSRPPSSICMIGDTFYPIGLAVDAAGNLYVANSDCDAVQQVTPGGAVSTFAGNGHLGFAGDGGPAAAAKIQFGNPFTGNGSFSGLTVDSAGNVYISDYKNYRVRKVTNGIITTVAGNGNGSGDNAGDGGLATSADVLPAGLAVDNAGNLYIADGVSRVRMVTPGGIITTVAGNGTPGYAGDGGPATSAELNAPIGVMVDASGNLYISDTNNNRIREVLAQPPSAQASPARLQFNATSGGALPPPQQVTFNASVTGLPFTVQVPDNTPWLTVSPLSGVSPRLITVTADPTNLSAGSYSATITINSPDGTPASSQVQVTFTVAGGVPPVAALDKQSLSFFLLQQSSALAQTLKISNSGGGTLNFTASAAVSTGAWLSVSPAAGQALPVTPVALTVTADPTGLSPGTYSGSVAITAAGNNSIVVPVTMTISALGQAIKLSQTGLAFVAVAQGGVVPPQSFSVLNIGSGVVNWTASTSTLAGGDWLAVNTDSGSSDASAVAVPTVQVSVNPAGLAAGQYYGLVQVEAATAANSPQVLTVFLQVLPAGTDFGAMVQPASLLFTAVAGAESPGSQNVSVYNMTAAGKSFQSSVSADPGLNLVTLAGNGTLDPQQPTSIVVQPFTSSLPTGIYNGAVTLSFSDGRVQSVKVQVVVTADGPASSAAARVRAATSSPCTPTKLLPSLTTLGQSFAVSAGWPVWLGVHVVDDCGTPLETGSVSASFSNNDPPVALQSLKGGYWEGTWPTSNNALAQVTMTLQAQNPQPQISGTLAVSGALQSPATPPAFAQSGVVSAASFQPYVSVAPGGIISIFGSFLAEQTASATAVPLINKLANTDTQVYIQGRLAPLYYVSQTQINALVPYELPANTQYQQVLVQRGLTYSLPVSVNVAEAEPAIFNCGGGQGCIVGVRNEGNTQLQFLASPATPAQAGDALVIYCGGLGAVSPPVADGYAPGSQLPTIPNSAVQVMIGNQAVTPFFAGLSPQFPGLYQVNVIVPTGAPTGSAVPVTIKLQGQTSPALTVAIQ